MIVHPPSCGRSAFCRYNSSVLVTLAFMSLITNQVRRRICRKSAATNILREVLSVFVSTFSCSETTMKPNYFSALTLLLFAITIVNAEFFMYVRGFYS